MPQLNRMGRAYVCLVGLVLIAAPVSAQPAPPKGPARPYRTLFGGNDVRIPNLHTLDLSISLDGGLDNGMYGVVTAPGDGAPERSGSFEQVYEAGAELRYARRGRRVGASLLAETSLPYYTLFPDEPLRLAYRTGGTIEYLSGRTTVGGGASFSYSPYYIWALDPAAGPGVGSGNYGRASALNPNNESHAETGLTYKLARQTSMGLSYGFDRTYFTEEDRANQNQGGRATISHQLSRRVSMTGGYGYRAADFSTGGVLSATTNHDLDAGFSYTVLGPRDRNTTFRAGVGSSFVDERGEQYQGWRWSFHFDRAVSTRWQLAADYGRYLRYFASVQEPVWSDDVRVSAEGYVNSRLQLMLSVNYSNGQRVSSDGVLFDTYWAMGRLQWALTEWVAFTFDYIFYRYDYPADFDLPAGMPYQLDRQRVQIGARFWLPLARAGRAGQASAPDQSTR
jgi:hypothetical protein